MSIPRIRYWLVAGLLAIGLWQMGQGAYIHAKAWLAQYLIRDAWEQTLAGATQVKPWPWADTWPVARIVVPRLDIEVFVLSGASGRTMAFGPGHLDGSAKVGAEGNSVLAAHRDTHFAFLRDLVQGDIIEAETPDGARHRYVVGPGQILDKNDLRPLRPQDHARLTLITCFPFDAVMPNGPLRYVVAADGV